MNTLFGYSIFSILVFFKIHYSLALLIATILGVIFNFKTVGIIVFKDGKNSTYLFIFRRGKWDLPKGKQDEDENIRTTALREVEEETGIDNLIIREKLLNTYHIYHQKETILKKTSWYFMLTKTTNKPVPQINEDITEVKWMSKAEVFKALENTYPSVEYLVEEYFTSRKPKKSVVEKWVIQNKKKRNL